MGNPPFLIGETTSNSGFPIAMLVYQRVVLVELCNNCIMVKYSTINGFYDGPHGVFTPMTKANG